MEASNNVKLVYLLIGLKYKAIHTLYIVCSIS
jgi:hypothetical protein